MKILVFQHLDVEHPGVFRDFWTERGIDWQAVELDAGEPIPDLDGFDVLAVMGGPMDVWQEDLFPWLKPEKAAIRRWVLEMQRPYLGICLGHQLLAEALGGKVGLMARPEVGIAQIEFTAAGRDAPLLQGLGPTLETLQWHGAEVQQLPAGASVLASNAACPIQAMRWGERAYGFQCHVEIVASTITDWERVPAYKASLEATLGQDGAAQLTRDATRKLPAFRATARQLDDNFWRGL